ncbi:MAG: hypothetical protein MK202_16365 [Tenacibaculum sp.]|nr:hypothetical protein [Tenacibaculum sp.]
MKKSILNLGKALNKADQRKVNGGVTVAYCNEGGRALIACIGGELLGYCRGPQGIYTIFLGPCF